MHAHNIMHHASGSGGHRGERLSDRTTGSQAVSDFDAFVSAGVTTFDTADIYGPSESLIGEYISRRRSGREGLQILTKCCKFGSEQFTVSGKSISQGVQRSLARLQVPYVDLVQLYWNDYSVPKYVDAALYLMDEVAAGRIKHLGVTNFDVPRLQRMVDAGAEIVAHQVCLPSATQ
jgi:aryl-alcohol dehydrogenase-like predicted oxidoreductase